MFTVSSHLILENIHTVICRHCYCVEVVTGAVKKEEQQPRKQQPQEEQATAAEAKLSSAGAVSTGVA
jgi:hypothetical protein